MTVIVILLISCHSNGEKNQQIKPEVKKADSASSFTNPAKLTLAMVVNQKDPSCYMSLADGIGDSTLYHGKVYGFCSKQCKEEFLRRPYYYVKD